MAFRSLELHPMRPPKSAVWMLFSLSGEIWPTDWVRDRLSPVTTVLGFGPAIISGLLGLLEVG
jgi:hypothetical protein